MYDNNTQFNDEQYDQINVGVYFDRLIDLIAKNDRTLFFIIRTENCNDQNAPFNQSQETRLIITHGDHMISQIIEGFIYFKIRITIQLSKAINSSNLQDPENLAKMKLDQKRYPT